MSNAALFKRPTLPGWHLLAPPAAAGACFVTGLFIGEPMAAFAVSWVRDSMIPAFMELYASGIPFCG